ncbi:MAG: T9SS type A sorting domain-containing protein, partial [Flavobacteriaceae bacterium]|nr:T9SS type A sorting domain-containing protein [Flavobacteriaceae bacterium]
NMTLDMFVYDAGTEEGDDYSTSNAATTPQENIFSRINIIPFNDQPIGTLTITLEEVLSVNSEAFESTVSIFPNPVEDHFKIQSSARFGIESIKIYDVLGQNVRDLNGSGRSSVKVYRQGLVAGMYLISLTDGNGNVVTKKILLN